MTVYSSSDLEVVAGGSFRLMSGQEAPMLELEAASDPKASGEVRSNCPMISSIRGGIGWVAGSACGKSGVILGAFKETLRPK